ncbi:DUF6438 domain-containing protein [Massilia litorea]|jgi:hypothetical protein|uniref:DUF6438 domain-containing protein n=1 Tax=Massilia litorea TaxID=2769491 RepID=A0A7L9U1B6_9BURK|nr:DUF6438 domain-containing protein [Massilia litorea]QOL47985.1 hypothetical protein LPB04_13245 [Massilia litorea]
MRSARTRTILTLAALLAGCSNAGSREPKAPEPFTDFDTLTFEQSACLFDCSVFELEIASDGRVRHSGPDFERTGGPHESRIDRRGLAQIAQALRDARVDEMRDSYQDGDEGCKGAITDMSTLSFHVTRDHGQRNKSVVLYAGCVGPTIPSARMSALIKAIDQVTGTGALLEQRKKLRRPDGEAVAPST